MNATLTREEFASLLPYQKTFLAMETQLACNVAIASAKIDYLLESREILYKQANLQVLLEGGTYEDLETMYEDAAEKQKGGIMETLRSIVDSIVEHIKKVRDLVMNKFHDMMKKNADKHMTPEDFDNSKLKQVMLNCDYEKKLAEIDAHLTTGQRMIRQVSSVSGLPETQVDGYCRTAKKLVQNLPKIAFKAAAGGAAVGGTVFVMKNFQSIIDGLDKKMKAGSDKVQAFKEKIRGKNPKQEDKILQSVSELATARTGFLQKISTGFMSILNSNFRSKQVAKTVGNTREGREMADYIKKEAEKQNAKNGGST